MSNIIFITNKNNEMQERPIDYIREKFGNIDIRFTGLNGSVKMHETIKVSGKLSIICGDNSSVSIGPHNIFEKFVIHASNTNCKIEIGERNNLRNAMLFANGEPGLTIKIGNDCLFSTNIVFRASDGHTIFDLTTREVINRPVHGISIGNHVWIGQNVTILKNVSIPDDCIIGIGSIVSSKVFLKNSIIAGIPAKIIKTNVSWDRKSISSFDVNYVPLIS